jgi:hypothetical protein
MNRTTPLHTHHAFVSRKNLSHTVVATDNIDRSMCPYSIVTALLLLVVGTSAFASKEAWKSRPSVPELVQTRGDAPKERLPWDAMRFMKQSSKFVSINPFSRKEQLTVQPGDLL